ncbi:hypothetical protein [Paraburkholderia solisilvae]|uniref:Uncharacterized protein n=1 Tax=Paraburkholderia solisilvae TaxID=624376 RepID=A0A6J5DQH2_9BURK|nr:hypothetical protein [Paraburkholderia solisilvae]CAB3755501.1 hypothetical protein LMG29739_02187 [Paraburkholderia solisilvae]
MSYNALYVPLDIGTWSCKLLPTSEYRSPSGEWLNLIKGEELHQLEEDRRAFDLYFRPNYDFRSLIRSDIDAICSFIRDQLALAHWDLPTDNAGMERILKQSVRDRRLIPVVNRDQRVRAYAHRPPPAPLRWPPSGGAMPEVQAIPYVGRLSLTVSSGPATTMGSTRAAAGTDFRRGGVAAGSATGAIVRSARAVSVVDAWTGDGITRLAEAQPFEYTPDASSGSVTEIAARGVRMTGNQPSGFRINPNGLDVDYFDADGNLCAQYHASHGEPHGHNFEGGVRDGAHLSMSPIDCR